MTALTAVLKSRFMGGLEGGSERLLGDSDLSLSPVNSISVSVCMAWGLFFCGFALKPNEGSSESLTDTERETLSVIILVCIASDLFRNRFARDLETVHIPVISELAQSLATILPVGVAGGPFSDEGCGGVLDMRTFLWR
jgi:hypothetical protein